MVNLIMSLIAPQTTQPESTSLELVVNAAAQPNTDTKTSLFDGLMAQQVQVQAMNTVLTQQKASAQAMQVSVGAAAQEGFPVDPTLEQAWLQTTGEEIVAGVPEDIDEVDETECMMVSVIPPTLEKEADVTKPIENYAGDILVGDAAVILANNEAQDFNVAVQQGSKVVDGSLVPVGVESQQVEDIKSNKDVAFSNESIQKNTGNTGDDSAKILPVIDENAVSEANTVLNSAMDVNTIKHGKNIKANSDKNVADALAEDTRGVVSSDQPLDAVDTNVSTPASTLSVAQEVIQSVMKEVLQGQQSVAMTEDKAGVMTGQVVDGTAQKLSQGKNNKNDAQNAFLATDAADKSTTLDAAIQQQKQDAAPRIAQHLGAALFREQLEAAHADAFKGALSLPTDGDSEAANNAELSLPTSSADMMVGASKDQPIMVTERHASNATGLYFNRGALQHASVHEQIQVQIQQAQREGDASVIQVELRPIELGSIKISLEIAADNSTQVVVSADRQDTLDMLQRDAKGLAKALSDAGLQADAGSLQFNMSGDGRSGGEAQAQKEAFGTEFESNDVNSKTAINTGESEEASASKTTQNYTVSLTQGLDISV